MFKAGPQGTSPYETWVLTLRAWGEDQSVSLDALPPLADDTYTPDTFSRLIDHFTRANQAAATIWKQRLVSVMGHIGSPFDLARELVNLRGLLARRVALCTHPSLPPGIRMITEVQIAEDIASYQSELEEAVAKSTASARLDAAWRDKIIAVVRENSFTQVLNYRRQGNAGLVAAPLPTSPSSATVAPRRRYRRLAPPTHE